jgi:hypothetical protein
MGPAVEPRHDDDRVADDLMCRLIVYSLSRVGPTSAKACLWLARPRNGILSMEPDVRDERREKSSTCGLSGDTTPNGARRAPSEIIEPLSMRTVRQHPSP